MLAGLLLFELERAGDVLRAWRDHADAAPDELSTACVVVKAPPEPFVPPQLQGRPVMAIAALYVGEPGRGAAFVAARELGAAADLIAPMPYTAFQAILIGLRPQGCAATGAAKHARAQRRGDRRVPRPRREVTALGVPRPRP